MALHKLALRLASISVVAIALAACSFSGGSDVSDGNRDAGDGHGDVDVDGDGDVDADAGIPLVERTLRFTNPADEAVSDVPVLVRLDSNCIDYSIAGDGGAAVRFFDGADELAHDVEYWDPTGVSFVWVSFPDADAESEETMTLRFGAVDARTRASTEVWQEFVGVWHLAGAAASEANAASTSFTGAAVGTTPLADGIAGPARGFTAAQTSQITFAGTEALMRAGDLLTLEIWIYHDYANDDAWPKSEATGHQFMGKNDGQPIHDFVLFRDGASAAGEGIGHGVLESDAQIITSQVLLPNAVWRHLAITFKGDNSGGASEVRYFLDGQRVQIVDLSNEVLETTADLFFLGGSNGFDGRLDEVRVANSRIDDDAIEFGHATVNDPNFVTCDAPTLVDGR